ncbi:MAG: hypothetical protein QXR00_06325 [Candidatus Bathyarchaeia archaeon]
MGLNLNIKIGLAVSLIPILFTSILLLNMFSTPLEDEPKVFFGVSFCGDTVEEARLLIDRVKDYTNLLTVLSGPISYNESALTEVCDYAFKAGLNVIVFFGDLNPRVLALKGLEWRLQWIVMAKERWGDKFLGVYYYDEPGGIFIDNKWNVSQSVRRNNLTYDFIANLYVKLFQLDGGLQILKDRSITSFVSDYALYWFDYLAGYDVVLAQIGWNHTFTQDIALVRGAATLHNKSWGIIITWKYRHPPYLDSPDNVYRQMLNAYLCGAKYIILFNYAEDMKTPYGILTDEYFTMLKRFWNEVIKNPKVTHGLIRAEAALVLPRNYGWGMRHPDDKIWGLWEPDEKSQQIWTILQYLLRRYGLTLDIIYEDPKIPIKNGYERIYYWNQTLIT